MIYRIEGKLYTGPKVDLKALWQAFKTQYETKIGPDPDMCSGSVMDWARSYDKVLDEYREKYKCRGDFKDVFLVLLLTADFEELLDVTEVRLD